MFFRTIICFLIPSLEGMFLRLSAFQRSCLHMPPHWPRLPAQHPRRAGCVAPASWSPGAPTHNSADPPSRIPAPFHCCSSSFVYCTHPTAWLRAVRFSSHQLNCEYNASSGKSQGVEEVVNRLLRRRDVVCCAVCVYTFLRKFILKSWSVFCLKTIILVFHCREIRKLCVSAGCQNYK